MSPPQDTCAFSSSMRQPTTQTTTADDDGPVIGIDDGRPQEVEVQSSSDPTTARDGAPTLAQLPGLRKTDPTVPARGKSSSSPTAEEAHDGGGDEEVESNGSEAPRPEGASSDGTPTNHPEKATDSTAPFEASAEHCDCRGPSSDCGTPQKRLVVVSDANGEEDGKKEDDECDDGVHCGTEKADKRPDDAGDMEGDEPESPKLPSPTLSLRTICVDNLPPRTSKRHLKAILSQFGELEACRVFSPEEENARQHQQQHQPRARDGDESRPMRTHARAYATYLTRDNAIAAIKGLRGLEMSGYKLDLKWAPTDSVAPRTNVDKIYSGPTKGETRDIVRALLDVQRRQADVNGVPLADPGAPPPIEQLLTTTTTDDAAAAPVPYATGFPPSAQQQQQQPSYSPTASPMAIQSPPAAAGLLPAGFAFQPPVAHIQIASPPPHVRPPGPPPPVPVPLPEWTMPAVQPAGYQPQFYNPQVQPYPSQQQMGGAGPGWFVATASPSPSYLSQPGNGYFMEYSSPAPSAPYFATTASRSPPPAMPPSGPLLQMPMRSPMSQQQQQHPGVMSPPLPYHPQIVYYQTPY